MPLVPSPSHRRLSLSVLRFLCRRRARGCQKGDWGELIIEIPNQHRERKYRAFYNVAGNQRFSRLYPPGRILELHLHHEMDNTLAP